jgi:hypothetical protein
VNYHEESSESDDEAPAEAEPAFTIEKIITHRDGVASEGGSPEREYLIKWLSFSHLHDTWETEEVLMSDSRQGLWLKGQGKLKNYMHKQGQKDQWAQGAQPEELEAHNMTEELVNDLREQWSIVERIVASRLQVKDSPDADGGVSAQKEGDDSDDSDEGAQQETGEEEFLCKWGYVHCIQHV